MATPKTKKPKKCKYCKKPLSNNKRTFCDNNGECQRKHKNSGGKQHPGGRPLKMVPETIQKLREAFLLGCTDEEACLFADISVQSLYLYQKNNPKFLDEKELLKKHPVLKARKTVVGAIDKDTDLAFKFLERRLKSEFGNIQKHELSGPNDGPIEVAELSREDLTKIAASSKDNPSNGGQGTSKKG